MKLLDIPKQVAESVLSIAGIRTVEEPHYLATRLTDDVEIRRYGKRIAAETTVTGDQERALNTGFRRLAGYIFGGNQREQKIAMTAPVAQGRDAESGSVIRFFTPSKWSMETLPAPNDDNVRLVTVPDETVAVLRFSGDRGPRAVATRTAELENVLRDNGVETTGPAQAWFYDPPWSLPFRRRSEIAIPVRR